MSVPTRMIESLLRLLFRLPLCLLMAVFSRPSSAFHRLWLNATALWRWTIRALCAVGPFGFRLLPWLTGSGSRGEHKHNAEDPPEAEGPPPPPEGPPPPPPPEGPPPPPEGQVECAGSEHREPARPRPRFEDDEGEFDGEEYRVDPTDELYCGYDSTWETHEPPRAMVHRARRPSALKYKFSRFESAARDMQVYRHDYPNNSQSQIRQQHFNQAYKDEKPNLLFYLGMKCSEPDGVYIHSFHQEWFGDYFKLESVHSFIQWLFPLQEPGMNYQACTLTKEEIKEFCQNDTAKANLLKSYKLMLDFYGIELSDEKTGMVKRASNWKERFYNMNRNTHNNLRITRILKCLGTLGYPHYQAPLVRFFLEETLIHRELSNVKDSVLSYFLFAVLDKRQRKRLVKFAYLSYSNKVEFVWCPRKIQSIWLQAIQGRKDPWDPNQNQFSQYSEDESQDEET